TGADRRRRHGGGPTAARRQRPASSGGDRPLARSDGAECGHRATGRVADAGQSVAVIWRTTGGLSRVDPWADGPRTREDPHDRTVVPRAARGGHRKLRAPDG